MLHFNIMLRSIYKTGSSVILPNPKDTDLIYYYDTSSERLEALQNYKHDNGDIHFRVVSGATSIFLGCYVYHYMQLIEGESIPNLESFSIFDEKIKPKYVECLKKHYNLLPNKHKKWYHIVIAYFLYKHGEYELSEKELKIAQSVHDKGITEQLKTEIGEYFEWL